MFRLAFKSLCWRLPQWEHKKRCLIRVPSWRQCEQICEVYKGIPRYCNSAENCRNMFDVLHRAKTRSLQHSLNRYAEDYIEGLWRVCASTQLPHKLANRPTKNEPIEHSFWQINQKEAIAYVRSIQLSRRTSIHLISLTKRSPDSTPYSQRYLELHQKFLCIFKNILTYVSYNKMIM